jgi:threonyl-tRNA synthetase
MIHRGVISTMERMMAFLIEHYAGNFPLWLAPVQLKVVTVTDQQLDYARRVASELKEAGWRVEVDERNEKLGYKIREAQLAKIPYAVVIGDKEVQSQTVAARRRGGENLAPMSVSAFIERVKAEMVQERGGS